MGPDGTPAERRRAGAAGAGGFGLLEALVALAILAGAGMALFAWIQQSVDSAVRLRAHAQRAQLQLAASDLIQSINPMAQPEGEQVVGSLVLRWQARPLEPPRLNASFQPQYPGAWRLGLYAVDAQVDDRSTGTSVRFTQWQSGALRTQPASQGAP